MKYVLRIHSRPNQSIVEKHGSFVEALAKIEGDWGLSDDRIDTPDVGTEICTRFPLGKMLRGKGIKGFVSYRFRSGLRDHSESDDYIDLEFNPLKKNYKNIIEEVFPWYVKAFSAYFAYIGNEEFNYIDFNRRRGLNQRDRILRVHPVMFFDQELCKRAFGIEVERSRILLSKRVRSIEMIENGLLLIADSEPVGLERAEMISSELLGALGRPGSKSIAKEK